MWATDLSPLELNNAETKRVASSGGARHNALRDVTASFQPKVTDYAATMEQRVVARDRVKHCTGVLEDARLDVCTRDDATGRTIYLDTMVDCAHSGYELCQRVGATCL